MSKQSLQSLQSLQLLISIKINRSKRNVFLRADFKRLGGYDQVGRVLRNLVDNNELIKIGYGLYAKARLNRVTGKSMLSVTGGFKIISEEALTRLNVKWEPSTAMKAYQAGSTQIPANAEVIIRKRFNRKIGTANYKLNILKS